MRCFSSPALLLLVSLSMLAGCRKPAPFQPPQKEKVDVEPTAETDSAALSESQVEAILAGNAPQGIADEKRTLVKQIAAKGGSFGYNENGALDAVDLAGDRVSVDDQLVRRLDLLAPLDRLRLAGSGITSASVATLLSFPELEHLYLRGVQFDDDDLARLSALTELKSVGLRRLVHMTDAGAIAVLNSKKLESVALIENAVTGKTVETLAGLPELRVLDLRDCTTLQTDGYRPIGEMTSLEVIRLSGHAVVDELLEILARLPKLRSVTLQEAGIGDAGLARLADVPLEELVLVSCLALTDAAMKPFREHAELQALTLRDLMLSDFDFLATLPKLKRLRLIELFVGPEELSETLAALEGLSTLELRDVMADDTTAGAIAGLEQLERLTLAGTQITAEGRAMLETSLPDCRIIAP